MKKKIVALVILGVIMLVGGGVGVALNFKAAEKQVTTVTNESYQVKDKKNQQDLELTLDLKGENYLNIQIIPSSDEQFHLNSKSYNGDYKPSLGWEINEKNNQTEIKLQYTEKKQRGSSFTFGGWDFDYTPITLSVPSSYKNITVTSASNESHQINLDRLRVKNIVMNINNNALNLTDIYAESLSLTGGSNDIYLSNVRVDNEIVLNSANGDIYLNDIVAERINSNTTDGETSLYDVVGNTELRSEYGDMDIKDLTGTLSVTSGRGDILLAQDKLKDNLDLINNSGEIKVILEKELSKLDLTTTTSTGELSIFGKSSEKTLKNNGGPKVTLTTQTGDIIMTTYDDEVYNDDYFQEDF